MPVRVWCWTPNPVLEIKFSHGRRLVSAGGKAHNVARLLCGWGKPAISLVAKVGTEWRQAAQRERVPIREIPIRSGARTGWAVMNGAGKRLDFFTEDPHWKSADWNRCGRFLRQAVRKGDWVVVAGSVPAGARTGWWRTLFLGLKKHGARILVDGKGQLLREGLQAGVDWAKANQAEAEETLNQVGASRCLAAMRILSRNRSCLLITRGSRGLVLKAGGKRLAVPAPKIRLRDATGSGDAVTAALIHGIGKGWEMEKIAGFSVWAGSENAARRDEVGSRLKG
ncbi:MAG: hypothetical protein EBT50_01505 [Verrucomicrobia bacterium]|nr:hypothetical protein [Verrucomicrobiota bacterium]